MEAGIIQFIALIPQKQVVAQNLRVVDLVFQLNNMGAKLFDLGFQRFQAGAHLGTAAALLLAIACLLGLILLLGGFRLFGSIAVMQLLEVLVESRLAIFQVQDRAAKGLHQVAVMGDQQQGARVGRQRISQRFAHENIQVVGRFVQKHQVRAFQGQLRKAQAGHLTAGKGGLRGGSAAAQRYRAWHQCPAAPYRRRGGAYRPIPAAGWIYRCRWGLQ